MFPALKIGPVIPGRLDLPARFITQQLNPFKRASSLYYSLLRADKDRSDFFYQQENGCSLASVCMGHYWDAVNKRLVTVKLGVVTLRTRYLFRPASSVATRSFAADNLSRGEGADHSKLFFAGAERPQRGTSEDAPQAGEKLSGSYVIPGQSPTGWTKQQKNGRTKSHPLDFEWSLEKCEAELC